MKTILLLLVFALIGTSCKKEKDITSMKIEEIMYPLVAPAINTNGSIEPKIRVRNDGTVNISSFAIAYNLDINNTGGGYIAGPIHTYFAHLQPNKDSVLILDKWETYPTNTHYSLENGTHMLLLNVFQINALPYQNEVNYFENRLFVLQR